MGRRHFHRGDVDFGEHALVVGGRAADYRGRTRKGRGRSARSRELHAPCDGHAAVRADPGLHQAAGARRNDHFVLAADDRDGTDARAVGDGLLVKHRSGREVDRAQRAGVGADDRRPAHEGGAAPVRAAFRRDVPFERPGLHVHGDRPRRGGRPAPIELGVGVDEVAVVHGHLAEALRSRKLRGDVPARRKRVGRHAQQAAVRRRDRDHAVGVRHAAGRADGEGKFHRLLELARLRVVGAQHGVRRPGGPHGVAFRDEHHAVYDERIGGVGEPAFGAQQRLLPRGLRALPHDGKRARGDAGVLARIARPGRFAIGQRRIRRESRMPVRQLIPVRAVVPRDDVARLELDASGADLARDAVDVQAPVCPRGLVPAVHRAVGRGDAVEVEAVFGVLNVRCDAVGGKERLREVGGGGAVLEGPFGQRDRDARRRVVACAEELKARDVPLRGRRLDGRALRRFAGRRGGRRERGRQAERQREREQARQQQAAARCACGFHGCHLSPEHADDGCSDFAAHNAGSRPASCRRAPSLPERPLRTAAARSGPARRAACAVLTVTGIARDSHPHFPGGVLPLPSWIVDAIRCHAF